MVTLPPWYPLITAEPLLLELGFQCHNVEHLVQFRLEVHNLVFEAPIFAFWVDLFAWCTVDIVVSTSYCSQQLLLELGFSWHNTEYHVGI